MPASIASRYLVDFAIPATRSSAGWILGAYAMIIGTYGLIVAAVYINHFWR
jgi:hypothetical protein